MSQPLVSVICLCYNHASFVKEAIASVIAQTYSPIEIIVVDDASTDASPELIQAYKQHPQVKILLLEKNLGNCAAFNRGLELARGKYVIDFATDDLIFKTRIEKQVKFFEKQPEDIGVIFSNVRFINESGVSAGVHFPVDAMEKTTVVVPEGDIFAELVSRYFISPPSMMMRKSVLDELSGYDEGLAYEDFDFWVRSARKHKYAYQDSILTEVRKVAGSLSSGWYRPGDPQLLSTYKICCKVKGMIANEEEKNALVTRLKFEFRQSVISENFYEAGLFYQMLNELKIKLSPLYQVLHFIYANKIKLAWLRKLYLKFRY